MVNGERLNSFEMSAGVCYYYMSVISEVSFKN